MLYKLYSYKVKNLIFSYFFIFRPKLDINPPKDSKIKNAADCSMCGFSNHLS